MVEMLALQLDYRLFILNLLSADRAYLGCFVVLVFTTVFSFSDSAKVLLSPARDLVERLFILWLLMEDPHVLGEPLLGSLLADVLSRGLARLLLVERQATACCSGRPDALRLQHRTERGRQRARLGEGVLAVYPIQPVPRSVARDLRCVLQPS